ncbi:MAG TPA: SUMF1/EgtB/PvdO family nonheme iron enzyme [Candidatus Sulfotelmatobacter sp.]|nr:SUMF1/EgtB/PvdO family nonheme iron enzyme [Candidatus Sulfotelmatobacter sp.]
MFGGAKLAEQPALLRDLFDARSLTDTLFEVVRSDALYERPIAERHRLIFYLGHLEAFDWNLLRQQSSALHSFHPAFDQLFAFGIDPVDGGLPNDQPHDWPSIAEIQRYNQRVRREIDTFLESEGLTDQRALATPANTLLHVAIEHRLMHAETIAYLLHCMPYGQKHSRPQAAVASKPAVVNQAMLAIPAGHATLGLPRNQHGVFGWDNEFEVQQVHVPQFLVDKFMVTNADFLNFLNAGAYHDRNLWRDSDWRWIQSQQIRHPAFWRNQGSEWFYRGMFEEVPLPLDWPVYVSYAEAAAYARWAGKSLPTEAQWHRAAYGDRRGLDREFPWGDDSRIESKGNFHFTRWDPAPVTAYRENVSAFGAVGMLGNGWEWCSTEFAPFLGFQAFPFYPGYSANFFDGQHFVLKGGSSRTAAPLLRRSFRNWFQAHYQYAYTGFRCVKNPEDRRPAC